MISRALPLVLALAALAAAGADESAAALPPALLYSQQVLGDLQGVVSWKTLAQVTPVKQGSRMKPSFSKEVQALDGQKVVLQGFMMPLEVGKTQRHFLVSAVPPSCPFCMPAGPEATVEVLAKKAFAYGFRAIVVTGKLAVLKDEPSGMLYRLTDAEPVETEAK